MKFPLSLSAALLFASSAFAQADQSLMMLEDWLHKVPGADAGTLAEANAPYSHRVFPPYSFYSVRFIGMPAPSPLNAHNLFAVNADGTVTRLSDEADLQEFFVQHLQNASHENDQRAAVKTWLRLAGELRQDGNLRFSIPDDSVDVSAENGKTKAAGAALITSGSGGEIDATLTFDASGRLKTVESKDKPR